MIYVYQCDTCSKKTEDVRRVVDRDEVVTCSCGGKLLRVEIPAGGGFILQGSGWFHKGGY